MKLIIDRDIFTEAIAWIARSLPVRPTIPVLSGILITAKDNGIYLDVFDYEVSARQELNAEILEEGAALVSGRLLAEISRSLPISDIHVQTSGSFIEILCAKSRFVLPTMQESDFPLLPTLPPLSGIVDAEDFAMAVQQVMGSASKDDTLPMLTGVKMDFAQEKITLVATDRFRLAVKHIFWQAKIREFPQSILIPARRLSEIAKSFPTGEKSVEISLPQQASDSIFGFSCGKRKATSRLLDQQYLSYGKLLPETHSTIVNSKVSSLTEAIKRVALVAFKGAIIRCEFSHDQIIISAGADEGGQAEETLPAEIYGQELIIAFNASYFIDGLHSLTSDIVSIGLNSPNKAVVLRNGPVEPVVVNGNDFESVHSDFVYLVMPTRLP